MIELPKEIAEKPIRLPGNSYYNELKSFGKGELWAGVINIAATAIAAWFGATSIVIALVGPLAEKLGFFIEHLRDAYNVYKTTPRNKRDKFRYYLWKAVRNGAWDLFLDVTLHDPIYVLLVYEGIEHFPDTPEALFAAASFLIALFVAAGVKVGINEIRYLLFQRRLRREGFSKESFIESRFHVPKEIDLEKLLADLVQEFNLGEIKVVEYDDTYFETNLPEFSGREPKLRLRDRTTAEGKRLRSLQVVYLRAGQEPKRESQFNFYPQTKDKFYYVLSSEQEMPVDIRELPSGIRKYAEKIVRGKLPPDRVHFKRSYANDPDTLMVATDQVSWGGDSYYIVEIKTYKQKDLLIEAMRKLMLDYPVFQITGGKKELAVKRSVNDSGDVEAPSARQGQRL